MINLRPGLGTDQFLARWESLLAMRGETVQVESEKAPVLVGTLTGLEADGSLILQNEHGESVTVRFGDVRLRTHA